MKNKWLKNVLKNNIFETIFAIILKIFFAGLLVLLSYSLSFLLDSYNRGFNDFKNTVLLIIGILILTILVSFISDVFKSKYIRNVNIYIREKINDKVAEDIHDLVITKNTGKKLSWYINDVDEIENKFFSNLIDVFHFSAMVLLSFISVIILHWTLAIAATLLLGLSMLIPSILSKYISNAQRDLTEAKEVYTENVRDNLESLNTLYISNRLNYFKKRMEEQNIFREDKNYSYNLTIAKTSNIMIFTSFLSQIGLTIFSLYISGLGYTTEGSVLSIAALSGNLFNGVQGLIRSLSILSSVDSITDKYVFENKKETKETVDNINTIKLRNVSFSYDQKQILDDFTFDFNKKKYAIIGGSGSGKSTLLKIILGILKVDNGEVLVNNTNITNINENSYFKNLAYIEQNIYLLNGTIRENILLGSEIDDAKLYDVLRKSNLINFIKSLPNGLETLISSNGQEISGGEKQRIAIARSLVKNVDYIIVDESTSQLDKLNRNEVENTLLGLENVGLIMISHNIEDESLNKFDGVIRLNSVDNLLNDFS